MQRRRSCRGQWWLFVLAVVVFAGCQPKHPFVWATDLPTQPASGPDQIPIQSGDRIEVVVRDQKDVSGTFEVGADGRIVQPLAGLVQVSGLVPPEAAKRIAGRLRGPLVNPQVTVSVSTPRTPVVSVVGEVRDPGHFDVTNGEGVLTALARAGGLTEFAKLDEIYVIRKFPRRTRVRFRYGDLAGGEPKSVTFELRDGDVVVVK